MNLCQYGCDKEGAYLMTSGKWCCSPHWNSCIGKRTKDSLKKKGKSIPWNKGLAGIKGHKHSEKTKNHLSKKAKERGLGGYIKGSGRGKSGWYNGIWCDSSWELAYVLYCKDHNIPIAKNTKWFKYNHDGEEHKYLPDFIRLDRENYYIEIKGRFTKKEINKLRDFPVKIKVLSGNGMSKFLNYVKNKYGRNFTDMYDINNGRS